MEETNCDELSTCYPTMETAIISPVTRRSTLRTNTIMLNLNKAFSPQRRDVVVRKYAWCDVRVLLFYVSSSNIMRSMAHMDGEKKCRFGIGEVRKRGKKVHDSYESHRREVHEVRNCFTSCLQQTKRGVQQEVVVFSCTY